MSTTFDSGSRPTSKAPPTTTDTVADFAVVPEQNTISERCSSPKTYTAGTTANDGQKKPLVASRSYTISDHDAQALASPSQRHPEFEKPALRKSSTVATQVPRSMFSRILNCKDTGSSEIPPDQRFPRRNSTVYTNASAPFDETAIWDRKAILSLDGGGIRGYSALLIIRALMREIGTLEKEYKKSATSDGPAESSYHPLSSAVSAATDSASGISARAVEAPITDTSPWLPCHYFDYMAGTSTGGLISIMIGRLRMNIDDCIRDYETLGDKVFGHSRWFHLRQLPPFFWMRDKYKHKVLQDVIREVVRQRVPKVTEFPGSRNFAFDENRCRVVVIAYQEKTTGDFDQPYLFRTYKNLHRSKDPREISLMRNPNLAHDIPIWQVARATSAAPTYFKPAKIDGLEYLDGGFGGTNNPSIEILDEVRRMNNFNSNCASIVVSVGTGKNNKLSRWTKSKAPGSQYSNYLNCAKKWASDSESTHNKMLREQKTVRFHYCRFNVEEGLDEMKLDQWRQRGRSRVTFGKYVGSVRRTFEKQTKSAPSANGETLNQDEMSSNADSSTSSSSPVKPVEISDRKIPKWLQPHNKTIETITRCTEAYLDGKEVKKTIRECAVALVEGRRQRARNDRERWEKACFDTWYQCSIDQCPRGEKEYLDRKKLELHLLDKHGDVYRKSSAGDKARLENALNEFKIFLH